MLLAIGLHTLTIVSRVPFDLLRMIARAQWSIGDLSGSRALFAMVQRLHSQRAPQLTCLYLQGEVK